MALKPNHILIFFNVKFSSTGGLFFVDNGIFSKNEWNFYQKHRFDKFIF
jgi:hypothetical protein